MAGKRTDDATVATYVARKLGVQTQAESEAERRAGNRVGAYGEEPRSTASPTNNSDDWTNTGNVRLNLDNVGNFVRIGPTGDPTNPLEDVNASAFLFVNAGTGGDESYLQGTDGLGFPIIIVPLDGPLELWQGGVVFKNVAGAETGRVNATTGAGDFASIASDTQHVATHGQWLSGFHADVGASTLSPFGIPAPTTSGSLSNATVADGPVLTFQTGAVSGNIAQILTATNWQTRWGIDVVMRVRTGTDITNVRLFAVLAASDPSASATPNIHYAGFRFDTGVPDTNWRARSCAAGGVTESTDTGVVVALNTTYELRIVSTDGTSILFYINGTLVATHATTLPSTSTSLGCYLSVTTLAAETNNFRVHHVKVVSR